MAPTPLDGARALRSPDNVVVAGLSSGAHAAGTVDIAAKLPYWSGHIAATAAMSYRRLHAHADVRALRNDWLRPREAKPRT
jgi:hypothetical protein